jgi:hypothetical protein
VKEQAPQFEYTESVRELLTRLIAKERIHTRESNEAARKLIDHLGDTFVGDAEIIGPRLDWANNCAVDPRFV